MNATADEVAAARETLQAEIALLRAKVSAGSTLRVGERRFLLSITDEADNAKFFTLGQLAGLDQTEPLLCVTCRAKVAKVYRTLEEERDACR